MDPNGLALLLETHDAGNLSQAAQETLASLGKGLQGRVRLSVPSGSGQMVVAPWLIAFKREVPQRGAGRAVRERRG